MKSALTRSSRPNDRLETAHATGDGVTLRDRRGSTFISFHRLTGVAHQLAGENLRRAPVTTTAASLTPIVFPTGFAL